MQGFRPLPGRSASTDQGIARNGIVVDLGDPRHHGPWMDMNGRIGLGKPTGDAFFTQHYPTMDVSGRFPFNQEGLVKVSAREILERKLSDHRPTAQSERAFRKGICISRSSAICHWYPRFKLHLVTVWAFILQDRHQSHNESEPAARIQYSFWMFLALLGTAFEEPPAEVYFPHSTYPLGREVQLVSISSFPACKRPFSQALRAAV